MILPANPHFSPTFQRFPQVEGRLLPVRRGFRGCRGQGQAATEVALEPGHESIQTAPSGDGDRPKRWVYKTRNAGVEVYNI